MGITMVSGKSCRSFFAALACFGLASIAQAGVSISPNAVKFHRVSTVASSIERTVQVRNDGSADATFGVGGFSMGANVGYSIISDNCQNTVLAPNSSCAVTVSFNPSRNAILSAMYGWLVDGVTTSVMLMNDVTEPSGTAAKRRLPPVVQKVEVFLVDAQGAEHVVSNQAFRVGDLVYPASELVQGETYRFTWYVAAYDQSVQSGIGLFNCGSFASVTDSSCAQNFGDRFANSSLAAGAAMTIVESQALGLPTYSFGGASAINVKYSHDFTLDSQNLTAVQDALVARFYQRGAEDATASESAISAIVPGGLDIVGQAGSAFLGNVGRKVKLPMADRSNVIDCTLNPELSLLCAP